MRHPYNPMVPMESPVPVIFAIDPTDFAAQLAKGFYGFPSDHMQVLQVVGAAGKSSTAWHLRTLFERSGIPTAMVSGIEWSQDNALLDIDGAPQTTRSAAPVRTLRC